MNGERKLEKKRFLKAIKWFACGAAAVLLLAALCWAGYEDWYRDQPKFHDVTVELGTESVSLRDFMTEYARAGQVGFVSDIAQVDLNQVGQYELTLRHGRQEETVCLTVQDTTAPAVTFRASYTVDVNKAADAADFVETIEDESRTRVYFRKAPKMPQNYADVSAAVVVEDRYGNKVSQVCTVSYRWMPETYTLELGETLTKEKLLLDPEKDADAVEQAALDAVNESPVGQYVVTGTAGVCTNTCVVTVQDTKGPELTVRNVKRNLGVAAAAEDFVESVSDLSGEVTLRLLNQPDFNEKGVYTVTIEAEDIFGNVTAKEATLYVATDSVPPVITGLGTLSVQKNSSPDFLEGVKATDPQDGVCEVTVDTGALDLTKSGTYYITYRSVDKSGNVASYKRKVVVTHDGEDTKDLVISIAKRLSDNPETIRNYVRSSIGYNHYWGGEDPVWHGFVNKTGNCYVHALCLKAIFDYKGIESRLIWVQNKTHYWLIVNIDGQWKHIDPTPGRLHSRFSLMNDTQRLATLSGRTWDTTLWPACE